MKTRHIFCAFLLVMAMSSVACGPKKRIYLPPYSSETQTPLPGYRTEDPQKALQRYTKYLEKTKPSDPKRAEAWKNTVGSAVQLGEYELAERNLNQWQKENREAPSSWDWNQVNAQLVLARQGHNAYTSYLAHLINRQDLDWTTREAAGMELAEYFWAVKEHALAFDALGHLYKEAPDDDTKNPLESLALTWAESLSLEELQRVQQTTLGADPSIYPWSMVSWAHGMKLLEKDKGQWAAVWPSLSAVARTTSLANRDFFLASLRSLEQKMGSVRQNIALLLPLSGPYAQVGWQIAKGAGCAWREGQVETQAPEVKVINTESPTFLEELKAIIGKDTIIGGPLRKEIWEQIRVAGLNRWTHFLTFLPSVEDEGVEAWRFFSSPTDQARALVRGCADLGVTSYAILYPDERFGITMTSIFTNEVHNAGAQVHMARSYDIDNPPVWGKAVISVLGASGNKNTMNPEPSFQAIFLPDSLSNAQQLVPLLHYYEETRLFVLGPQLWAQSMGGAHLEEDYFDLAMFPDAWDPNLPTSSAKKLWQSMKQSDEGQADLWAALGYDFVHFTALLGGSHSSADDFNQALTHAASRMPWSLAPMRWIGGKASQDLFLFQPTQTGMVRADTKTMLQAREVRQQQRNQRRGAQ